MQPIGSCPHRPPEIRSLKESRSTPHARPVRWRARNGPAMLWWRCAATPPGGAVGTDAGNGSTFIMATALTLAGPRCSLAASGSLNASPMPRPTPTLSHRRQSCTANPSHRARPALWGRPSCPSADGGVPPGRMMKGNRSTTARSRLRAGFLSPRRLTVLLPQRCRPACWCSRIDHGYGAREAGLELQPTEVLISVIPEPGR